MFLQTLKVMGLHINLAANNSILCVQHVRAISEIPSPLLHKIKLFCNRTKFKTSLTGILPCLDYCYSLFNKVLKAPKGCVIKCPTFPINLLC